MKPSTEFPIPRTLPPPSPTSAARARAWTAGLAAVSLAPLLGAQSVVTVLETGDPIDNLGTFTATSELSVNDDGEWLAIVSYLDSQNSSKFAAVLNGSAILIQDDLLANTGGKTLAGFNEAAIDEDVRLLWSLRASGSSTEDQYLFNSLTVLGAEDQPAFSGDLSDTYEWSSFGRVEPGGNGRLFVGGLLRPISGTGSSDVLVQQDLDAGGNLAAETVLLLDGQMLDGRVLSVIGLNRDLHDIAGRGDHWAAFIRDDGGNGEDVALVVDGSVVIREGSPAPVTGFSWGSLSSTAVDINESGSWLAQADVTQPGNSYEVLVRDGQVLYSKDDPVATTPPTLLVDFGNTNSVHIAADGTPFYVVRTDSADTSRDAAIVRGERVIVQEGVTSAAGAIVDSLKFGGQNLDVSPSGRYVLFRATLTSGNNALCLIDLGLIAPMASCTTNLATLEATDGLPLLGETVTFELDQGQRDGVAPIFLLSTAPYPTWPSCGLLTPFGELLVDVQPSLGNPAIGIIGAPWTSGTPATFQVTVPQDLSLVGPTFYAQGLFFDFGTQGGTPRGRFSNGLTIALAPS